MKAIRRSRLWIALLVVLWSLINGSDGAMDVAPVNILGFTGETFTLTAEGDTADDILWLYDGATRINNLCETTDATYTATPSADVTDCSFSRTLGQDTSGTYTATVNTPSTQNYKAVVVALDAASSCEVNASDTVEAGHVVHFVCSATYYTDEADNLGTPTIGWDSNCGGAEVNNTVIEGEPGVLFSIAELTLTGCEVPSCNCTVTFPFTDPGETGVTYATNTPSYECSTAAVSSCTSTTANTATTATVTGTAVTAAGTGTGTDVAGTGAAATDAEATTTAPNTNFIITLVFGILAALTLFFICIVVYNWNKVGPAASAMAKPAPYYPPPAPYPPPAYPPPAYPPRRWNPGYPQPRRPFFPRRRNDYGYGNNMIYY